MRVLAAYPSAHNDPPFRPPAGVDVVDYEPWIIDGAPPHLAPDPEADPAGAADVLEAWARHLGSEVLVPLVEEAVLPCGVATSRLGLARGIDTDIARRATDRRWQREALPSDLSPAWVPDDPRGFDFPLVVKAPASTLSRGVRVVDSPAGLRRASASLDRRYADRLCAVRLRPDYEVLFEAFVPGEQWEVGGVLRKRRTHTMFRPLRHVWNRPAGAITDYVSGPAPRGLMDAALLAVEALGLRDCGFCVELRGEPGAWKVVEVHARTGEDDGDYHATLTGGPHPAQVLCEALAHGA